MTVQNELMRMRAIHQKQLELIEQQLDQQLAAAKPSRPAIEVTLQVVTAFALVGIGVLLAWLL